MADQQRFVVNKFPVRWPTGMGDAVVRVDTATGRTWVLVGGMKEAAQSHTFKWQIVEDPDLSHDSPEKSSRIAIG